jgi:hypothetical protein
MSATRLPFETRRRRQRSVMSDLLSAATRFRRQMATGSSSTRPPAAGRLAGTVAGAAQDAGKTFERQLIM